jgi:hypothetical protein
MSSSPVTLDFSKAQPIEPPNAVTLDFTKAQAINNQGVSGDTSIGAQLAAKGQTSLSDQLRQMAAAQSGQTAQLSPAEIAQSEAGQKAGITAGAETIGGMLGGELAPAAKGLIGAISRMFSFGAGVGAGNVAGQAVTTGKVDPVEALKQAAKGTALQAVGEGVAAIPSAAKAGASLQDIKTSAGDIPIDMSKPGNTALELYTQSQRGATLPKAVRDFVNRATKPDAPPITYAEAKDFQSNISSLSTNEKMALKPNTARLVGQLNSDLKGSLQDAAEVVGKGQQFTDAMQEYHNAMQAKGWTGKLIDTAWKAALTGAGLGVVKKMLP